MIRSGLNSKLGIITNAEAISEPSPNTMKNVCGWKDKNETDVTSKGQPLRVGMIIYRPPDRSSS